MNVRTNTNSSADSVPSPKRIVEKAPSTPNMNKANEVDKWAENLISSWKEINEIGWDSGESLSKRKDLLLDLKTFLCSYPPRLKADGDYECLCELISALQE